MNFNEIFRKNVAYDNNKIREKAGFHNLSRKHIFQKTTWGWVIKFRNKTFRNFHQCCDLHSSTCLTFS